MAEPQRPLERMIGPPQAAPLVLAAMVNDRTNPYTINELSQNLGCSYHTVRLAIIYLLERDYVQVAPYKRRNAQLYITPIESIKQLEQLVDRSFEELVELAPEVLRTSRFEVDEQPLEAWLKGYASKAGRTSNAKRQTDMVPLGIAELFNIALLSQTEKIWSTQARLDDLKEELGKVVESFSRLTSIVQQILANQVLWDARYILNLIVRGDVKLDTEELEGLVASVKENYGSS